MANPWHTLARAAACAMLGATLALASPAPAHAQDLVVKYDQSQLVRIGRPVAEVIIGNPTVAEVSVHNPTMLIVTGKTFGITNMILLDNERNIISEQRVVVVRDNSKVVSLQRGTKRESYNCTPQCAPAIMIGDDPQFFEAARNMSERKMRYSEQGAQNDSGGGGGGGNQ